MVSRGLMGKLFSVLVILFPVAVILSADSIILALTLIVFVSFQFKYLNNYSLSREEKLLFYSSLLVSLLGVGSLWAKPGAILANPEVLSYLAFLLAYPLYQLFTICLIGLKQVAVGLILGVVVYGANTLTDIQIDNSFSHYSKSVTELDSIPVLISIVVFFSVIASLFKKFCQLGDTTVRNYALLGLVLTAGFIAYFSYSIYQGSAVVVAPAIFYLTLLISLTARAKTRINEQESQRTKKLSVTVIAYNEVDRLGDCLESVSGWADEIIVFDNGSTDGTIELAKKYTDNVFVTDWPGFGKQKQRALDKAQYEWVLSIDADERVTPSLKVEIDNVLSSDKPEIAYRIPWAVTIYNKRLDFGRSGRAPLRLFKKNGAKFSEASVHEKVLLPEGKVGLLQERLLHFTHRNLQHAVRKFNDYAWLWGTERFEKGKRVTFLAPVLHGLWTFFVIYFLRLGLLDGFRGLVMAVHLSLYTFNKYTVLWTLEQQHKQVK